VILYISITCLTNLRISDPHHLQVTVVWKGGRN